MKERVEIVIPPSTIISTIVVISAAAALWFLRDLALLVITAVVLASAVEPGINFFMRYKIPRFGSALLMYLIIFGSVVGLFFTLVPPVVSEVRTFLLGAPQYLQSVPFAEQAQQILGVAENAVTHGGNISDTLSVVQGVATNISAGALAAAGSVFGGIFMFFLVIVLSFYFTIQETGVDDFLRLVTPKKHEAYVVDLWKRAQRKIGLWMQGQLLLSLLVGVIVYLGLLILSVPYALLLALIAALFNIIPMFGSVIAGIIGTIVAFVSGGVTLALLTAGMYFIVNQFEGNLIYPLIVDKVVGVPPLMVIIAMFAGGSLMGFLGVLLAVPFSAALREFINDVDAKKRAKSALPA